MAKTPHRQLTTSCPFFDVASWRWPDSHTGCPSKTKTRLVQRVDDAVFCQSLVMQLGRSDAETKPQLVTEVLPGLEELLQTQGHFCNHDLLDFFSLSPPFGAQRDNSSVMAATATHVPVWPWSQAGGVHGRLSDWEWQPRRSQSGLHHKDRTPLRRHTPWTQEKQKQKEPRHKFQTSSAFSLSSFPANFSN